MPIQEQEKNTSDLFDFLSDACSDVIEIETDQGIERVKILNTKKVYYKTQMVNSPHFSRFVKELEDFEAMGDKAKYFMAEPRALQLKEEIISFVRSFQYGMDAKSSESLRDKYNTQGTLIHEFLKNKVEKAYTLKGETKKSFLHGFLGRDGQEEYQN